VSALLRSPKILGVVFLVMVIGAVYLTYAIFDKKFVSYDEVTLESSSVGLQLPERADVKVRGVIVGEVLDMEPRDGGGAKLTLGLYPDKRDIVDADVTASILPKTLFGEKFVSLIDPPGVVEDPIEPGDTITQTRVGTEVEQVLNDLYPLLTTVQPAELNMTLNAIVTALEGRGEQIGESLETLDGYLTKLNPQVPQLLEDLRQASEVSDIYSDILPEVANILDNTIVTTTTLENREQRVQALFNDVSAFSDTTRTFLADNEERLVSATELSTRQLRVLARYSTEFPCLSKGLVNISSRLAEAFRGFKLHINLEVLPNQPRAYNTGDLATYGERRGPSCVNLPTPPWTQENPLKRIPNFADGVEVATGKGTRRAATGSAYADGKGYAGSRTESDLYRDLLAPGLGVDADDVSDLGPLLVGPMARGAEVSLR